MKTIKDKNNLLKKACKNFKNSNVSSLKMLLTMFADILNIYELEIINIDLEYDLEISIIDSLIDYRIYKLIISYDETKPILVEISDKNYIESYILTPRGFLIHDARIYQNDKKTEIIERKYNHITRHKIYLPGNNDNNYNNYLYKFKNNYLNSEIDIKIPKNFPFVEGLFIKTIFESSEEINNIDMLFYIIKNILCCKDVSIKICNNQEIIDYQNGKLLEYVRITNDQKIEYKDGFDKLRITKYETESLENENFQKILKIVRS